MVHLTLTPEQLKILEEALKFWIDDFAEGTAEYFPPEWKKDFELATNLKEFISAKLNEQNSSEAA
jgi:hypothetical protein